VGVGIDVVAAAVCGTLGGAVAAAIAA